MVSPKWQNGCRSVAGRILRPRAFTQKELPTRANIDDSLLASKTIKSPQFYCLKFLGGEGPADDLEDKYHFNLNLEQTNTQFIFPVVHFIFTLH